MNKIISFLAGFTIFILIVLSIFSFSILFIPIEESKPNKICLNGYSYYKINDLLTPVFINSESGIKIEECKGKNNEQNNNY